MATFEVASIFRVPAKEIIAISGNIREGVIASGMSAYVFLDGAAYWTLPIESVESVDHLSTGQAETALIIRETDPEQFPWLEGLCKPGDKLQVK